jgi:ribulose-phosphate 3-epimerase
VTHDPHGVATAARALGLAVGVAFNPGTEPARAAAFAGEAGAEMILCMSIHPGYSGQTFMPTAFGRIRELAALVEIPIQVDGGVGEANAKAVRDAGATLLVAGSAVFADPDPAGAFRRIAAAAA